MENNNIIELYQEIILDHNKNPRNAYKMLDCSHSATGDNPLCGDEITIYLNLQKNKIINISFTGQGCAIFKSSSSMMTIYLKDKFFKQGLKTTEEIGLFFINENKKNPFEKQELGDLIALTGVRNFPSRIKCAMLPWYTFKAATENKKIISIK